VYRRGIETIIPPRATTKTKKIKKQYERDGRMLDVYRVSSSHCKICPHIAIKENDLSKIREDIAAYILVFGVNLAYAVKMFLFLQNIPKKMRYLKI